jgi:hypothetical protein
MEMDVLINVEYRYRINAAILVPAFASIMAEMLILLSHPSTNSQIKM